MASFMQPNNSLSNNTRNHIPMIQTHIIKNAARIISGVGWRALTHSCKHGVGPLISSESPQLAWRVSQKSPYMLPNIIIITVGTIAPGCNTYNSDRPIQGWEYSKFTIVNTIGCRWRFLLSSSSISYHCHPVSYYINLPNIKGRNYKFIDLNKRLGKFQ